MPTPHTNVVMSHQRAHLAGRFAAEMMLASIAAASVLLVGCGPNASHAQGAAGHGGPPPPRWR